MTSAARCTPSSPTTTSTTSGCCRSGSLVTPGAYDAAPATTSGREVAVTTALDQLELLAPALAFLLAAVPLAHLLGELGFFDAVARRVSHRVDGIWPWWLLAAATTAVLNLDTTVVLLTPLYLQVARRRGDDPLV